MALKDVEFLLPRLQFYIKYNINLTSPDCLFILSIKTLF